MEGNGRYEQAARWVQSGLKSVPDSYWAARALVAAEALSGTLSLLHKDGNLTVASARTAWPFTPTFMERLGQACRALDPAGGSYA